MRWKIERLWLGKFRIVEKFLWFPKTIDNERRWLEKCKILQQTVNRPYTFIWENNFIWEDDQWIDDENTENVYKDIISKNEKY